MFKKKQRIQEIIIKKDDTWAIYERPNSKDDACNCKLHLAMGLDEYKVRLPKILTILTEGISEETFPAFKVLIETNASINRESIQRTQRRIGLLKNIIQEIHIGNFTNESQALNLELTGMRLTMPADDDKEAEIEYLKEMLVLNEQTLTSKWRIFHMPVTIYLPKECNFKMLGKLCIELEKELKDLPNFGDFFSKADLPLSPHIYFRKEGLSGNDYITVQDTDENEIEKLKQAGLQSPIYNSLLNVISTNSADKSLFHKRW